MFENLRNAFSSAAKSFGEKELKEKDIDEVLFQLELSLLESDVAIEVIDSIKNDLKTKLVGIKVNKNQIEQFISQCLRQTISDLFESAGTVDIISKISNKKDSNQPFIILFVGINGTGKTTTLAKLAYLLQHKKFSVVIAAADTYRAGAIEQLKEHANRLKLKLVTQNYGADPAAVAKDAVLYAQSHNIDCVLIDSAGRMQTSKNLMDQISKINMVVKPDFKIFVGDSLAANDAVNQAQGFFEHVKFDGSILTKTDADARGGAALSIVKVTSTPILYLGVGQEYQDLKTFDKDFFLDALFGRTSSEHLSEEITTVQEKSIKIEKKIEEKPEKPSKEEKEVSSPPTIQKQEKPIQTEINLKSAEAESSSDPFEGIETSDIDTFVDQFDIPPPEKDNQAKELASKIRIWILQGRPSDSINHKETLEDDSNEPKTGMDEEKLKKKPSLFGRFKK